MVKKIVKLVLVVMMLVGIFIAVANTFQSELQCQRAGKWVKYHEDIPDCFGEGTTCYDMTGAAPR